MSDQKFVTEDLTFVTVLQMDGLHYETKINHNGGCRWVYSGPVVGKVLEKLDDYNDNECFVEAKEFTKTLGSVRREMYQFLDKDPRRNRQSASA